MQLKKLRYKVLLGFLLGILFNPISVSLSKFLGEPGGWNEQKIGIVKALIASVFVIGGLYLLRVRMDKGFPKSIGVGKLKEALRYFFFGASIIVAPLTITLVLTKLFDWSSISINWDYASSQNFLVGIIMVFFFEAIPEEMIFRGYI